MEFTVEKVLPNGLGRAGTIKTAHGEIKTPAFMAVGTHGYVKFLDQKMLRETGAEAMLSNGYHLRRQATLITKTGGLANWQPERTDGQDNTPWQGPTLTDSGGFQVMSLGSGLGKVVAMDRVEEVHNTAHKERLALVNEEGVSFTDPFDGRPDFIGPEESMRFQCEIGADIHMAFDELTSLADDYDYNVEALKRTERWAERSLIEHIKCRDNLGYRQNLYGVLQGGRWEDLRRSTAKKLGSMTVDGIGFDGFGLGGAFLKEDLGEILRWCNEELPFDKPRHLLGLSHPDDIFVGVAMGADTFDCVAPMREARHGKIYTKYGSINLRKMTGSGEPLDKACDCSTCKAGWTMGSLRALWRSDDALKKRQFYTLATAHNLRFIVRLVKEVRKSILEEYFDEFRQEFLANYYQNEL